MRGKILFLMCAALLAVPSGICRGESSDVSGLLKQAEELRRDDQYGRAEEVYKQIIKEKPGSEDALAAAKEMTRFYILTKQRDKAIAAYEKMLAEYETLEKLPEAVIRVADTFAAKKRYSEALGIYRHVLEQWPSNEVALEAQRGIVQVNILLGDDAGVQAGFDRMVSEYAQYSGITDAVYSIGCSYAQAGRHEKAIEVFDYVEQGWPSSQMAVWSKMAIVVSRAGLSSKAGVEDAMQKLQAEGISDSDAAGVAQHLGDFCRYLVEIDDKREPRTTNKLLRDFGEQGAGAAVDHMGDLYRDTGKYDKAAEAFESIAQLWPDSERAIESQANIVKMYISIADEPNATAYFDKLISKFGQSAGIAAAVENVAQEYLELRNTQKAYEKFHYILEHWPGSERAIWAKMGMVMSRIRGLDLEAGESELLELLEKYSQDKELPDAVHEIVEEYRNVGAYTEGREVFEYLLENPFEGAGTMLELQVGIALQSIRLGEPNKVEAAIEKLIADYNDNPNIGKALWQIAEEHFYARNYGRAASLMELIRANYPEKEFPSKTELPYILGKCYEKSGDYEKAIANYKEAVRKYPHDRFSSRAPYRIAVVCMREKKDYEQAAYWFEQQRELYPNSTKAKNALYFTGVTYLAYLKDYVKAAEAFEQYLADYPEGTEIRSCCASVARCYAKLGHPAEALAVLQRAYEEAESENLRSEIMHQINALEEGGAQ